MRKNLAIDKARKHHSRDFKNFSYVYPVISRRSGGVSIGINVNRDGKCNFNCPYCQVDRTGSGIRQVLRIDSVLSEVRILLEYFNSRSVCTLPLFKNIPGKNRILRDVALSGDGEPTMIHRFAELCRSLRKLQAQSEKSFKLVLITNGYLLNRKRVLEGIGHLLKSEGEVWAKLDAGSEAWHKRVNGSAVSLNKVEKNLITAGQKFPLKIQTLFFKIKGLVPSSGEIELYNNRLLRMLEAGVVIPEVQLHTIVRKPARSYCKPLSRSFLLKTRRKIGAATGLKVVVY